VTRKVATIQLEETAGDLARSRVLGALEGEFELRESDEGVEVFER
jgi:hypothetical protein